jgi:hypothetical protein
MVTSLVRGVRSAGAGSLVRGNKRVSGFSTADAVGVAGVAALNAKLREVDPRGLAKERAALIKSARVVADVAKSNYLSAPRSGKHYAITNWHYGRGGYPARGTGAQTIKPGIDKFGIYVGAGLRRNDKRSRRDMRGMELGGGRHPLKAYRNQPRNEWTWYPIPHRPFLGPAARDSRDTIVKEYRDMLDKHIRSVGLNTGSVIRSSQRAIALRKAGLQ